MPTDMCAGGRPERVDVTIASMRQRFEPLARGCDHDGMFALAYLRTTQTYKWARDQPGFFGSSVVPGRRSFQLSYGGMITLGAQDSNLNWRGQGPPGCRLPHRPWRCAQCARGVKFSRMCWSLARSVTR
jgi:hypothetical protein